MEESPYNLGKKNVNPRDNAREVRAREEVVQENNKNNESMFSEDIENIISEEPIPRRKVEEVTQHHSAKVIGYKPPAVKQVENPRQQLLAPSSNKKDRSIDVISSTGIDLLVSQKNSNNKVVE